MDVNSKRFYTITELEMDALIDCEPLLIKLYLVIKKQVDFKTGISGDMFKFNYRYFLSKLTQNTKHNIDLSPRKLHYLIEKLDKMGLIKYLKNYRFDLILHKKDRMQIENFCKKSVIKSESKNALLNRVEEGIDVKDCEQNANETRKQNESHIINKYNQYIYRNINFKKLILLPNSQKFSNEKLVVKENLNLTKKPKSKSLVKEDFEEIVNFYHETLPEHPAVFKLTNQRKKAINARYNEMRKAVKKKLKQQELVGADENYLHKITMNEIKATIERVRLDKFLSGKVSSFIANIDTIFRENNFFKIYEKGYNK